MADLGVNSVANTELGNIQNQEIKETKAQKTIAKQTGAGMQALEADTVSLSSSVTKLKKNKGFINFIKHLFTGKDYYKSSTGIKVSTDRNTGSVSEGSDKEVYINGVENANIKGTFKDDNINVISSSVKNIDGNLGSDEINIENSVVENIIGNNGNDSLTVENCKIEKIDGGNGNDEITAINSKVSTIDGNLGKDNIVSDGGHVDNVASSIIDNVEIHNNPLNQNPNGEYAF